MHLDLVICQFSFFLFMSIMSIFCNLLFRNSVLFQFWGIELDCKKLVKCSNLDFSDIKSPSKSLLIHLLFVLAVVEQLLNFQGHRILLSMNYCKINK